MSVKELIQRLSSMPAGAEFDVRKIRDEIHQEFKSADTVEEQVILLQLFNAVMDNAERHLSASDLENFRSIRKADYNLLIISKCLVGENVSPEALESVTRREVAAGRMAPMMIFVSLRLLAKLY